MVINVLTPIREGEIVADDLSNQTIKCNRYTHSCSLNVRRDNEAYNRIALVPKASDPYTILMDADVVLPQNYTIERMIDFLDKYPIFPAVAVDTKGKDACARAYASASGHTIIALMCIRKKALDVLSFTHLCSTHNYENLKLDACLLYNTVKLEKCLCPLVNKEIREMYGCSIPYLREVSAFEKRIK